MVTVVSRAIASVRAAAITKKENRLLIMMIMIIMTKSYFWNKVSDKSVSVLKALNELKFTVKTIESVMDSGG